MENNIMFASRIGIAFYFYGISKERKELIKEVFGHFNRITNFRFKYYYSTGNWKKINKSTDILTILNNNIDKYTDYFEDVNIINFTDESEIQMSNISFEMYLIDDMEIQWPSYIYCELPFMDIKLIRTYMINTFNVLHCQYACANPVISYNTHISKSFTKSMKYLLNTKIYSSKFSIYTNHFLLINMKAKNRIVQFKGLDGVNFIQIYAIDWFHIIKKDFIDKAEKKGLLSIDYNKQYALTQLKYKQFINEENEQIIDCYRQLYNIYKPIIINFSKPVGFWKEKTWFSWRNRFYDVPMKSETDREIDMKKILNITDKKMQIQIIDKVKEDIDLEDLTIGYFIKKYLLKNEFIASENLWSRYRELYDEGKNKGFIPIIIDGNFDTVVLNSARNIKEPINETGIKDMAFNENLLKEYQDEFDDTVKSLPKKKSIRNTTLGGVGKVLIIELRIDYPYELFKIIPFGGFNDCPAPKIQYQVAKQWYKNFGAIPIVIGEDYIQYYMKNDIKNIDELRKIVCEQCCYCELEGQTIKELANSVYNDRFWYFWWD